jgi:DNA-directed RNA polymerase subunit RPC12/RpoP
MNWLRKFFYGRHGADQLSLFLFIVYLVIAVLSQIYNLWPLYLISWAIFVWSLFRMFSRNHARRAAENNSFMVVWYRLRNGFKNFGRSFGDLQKYRYFSCPGCGQKVRVPRGKGKVNISCPKCGLKFLRKV